MTKAELIAELTETRAKLAALSASSGERDAAAMAEMTYALTASLDSQEIIGRIVSRARSFLNSDNSILTIPRTGDNSSGYRIVASEGLSEAWLARIQKSRTGVLASAMRRRQVLATSDLLNDSNYPLLPHARAAVMKEGYRSAAAAPLIVGDHLLGALGVARATVGGFTTRELELLKQFAAHAALALEHAYMFEQIQERASKLEKANERLQEIQERLVRQERLATIGQIAATVSHELRNPLGTMRTALFRLTQLSSVGTLPSETLLGRMERSIRRCENIVAELLDFSRVPPMKVIDTQIDSWLSEVLTNYEFPPAIEIDTRLTSGAIIRMDPERIRQAVLNVLDNACQALIDQPNLAGGNLITVVTRTLDDRVEIAISDNGPGMSLERREKAFEPLYSTKSFGVGLGLPLVLQILQRHQGGAAIDDGPSGGTEVMLWLPTRLA